MYKKILLFTDDNGKSVDPTAMQDLRNCLTDSITGTDYGLSYVTMAMEWSKKIDPIHVSYVLIINASELQIQSVIESCPSIEELYSLYNEGSHWYYELFEVDEGEVINNTEHEGLPKLDFLKDELSNLGENVSLPFTVENGTVQEEAFPLPSKIVSVHILDNNNEVVESMEEDMNKDDLKDTPENEAAVHVKQNDINLISEEENKIKEIPEIQTVENDVNYQRTRTIQKQLFARQEWQSNKTIGVWSPIHQTGVTTFVINFALYLAKHRIYTGVLEGLTSNHILKYWLNRYTSIPNDWVSYASVIHEDIEPTLADWKYGNVLFLPLNDGDIDKKWTSDTLETYLKMPSLLDIILVDMPTGEMNKHTVDSLLYLSELWIVVDDSFHEIIAWKEYISQLNQLTNIPIRLVFNKTYKFSQIQRLEKELGYPLIAELPSLHEEVKRNYYQTKPLIYMDDIYEQLHPGFNQIREYLFGDEAYAYEQSTAAVTGFLGKVKNRLKKYFMDSC
ncbi:hypothetical protein PVA17_22700 [Lysinibacillus sp. CNPSo 3705]|uniref:hypothetical protein n=1 Tax=Lysinibacillus sp. CNPSo 3705 TaxID=3028148 RepID=UPI002363ABCE|nr:hypothetical protein [Lysinibacillus sp. CNPSo 3705]MDD1505533.1 hypothetical protein [Lysinibacillus sp. CNPSo 3705]